MPQFPDWNNPHWYDDHHNAWVKGHDKENEFYDSGWEALLGLQDGHHLLEIGAGTGKFSEGIIKRYPKLSSITLVDPDQGRLTVAQEKLGSLRPLNGITFLPGKLENLERTAQFDVIVCMHAMREALAALALADRACSINWLTQSIQHIYDILTAGGTFLWGDEVGYVEEHGYRQSHISLLEAWEIIELLHAAGFAQIECIYRYRNLAIHRATK